jgi:hypothetical protein
MPTSRRTHEESRRSALDVLGALCRVRRRPLKQVRKRFDGKCHLCDVSIYYLLDAHRIYEGAQGGKYQWDNILVVCSSCHRKIHAGAIKILGRRACYGGSKVEVVHYVDESGVERWK